MAATLLSCIPDLKPADRAAVSSRSTTGRVWCGGRTKGAAPELVRRARQPGWLVDDVPPGPVGLGGVRKQLDTFLATYAAEAQTKGVPVWHPLPFQFPEDPECARHTGEFMLGDEMPIAPIYEPGNKRALYLPQGVWTNLDANEVLSGRRTITVETAALPVVARNGTIVPLDSAGALSRYCGRVRQHQFERLGVFGQRAALAIQQLPARWRATSERTYRFLRPSA